MGCSGSTTKGGSKAQAFKKLAEDGNPLAQAMLQHWTAYVKEQKYKCQGNTDTYEHLAQRRQKKVRVNKSVEEAKKAGLNRKAVHDVATKFLAYAMADVAAQKTWSGDVQFTTSSTGQDCQMKVTGRIQYEDNKKRKCTESYHVIYEFCIA